MVYRILLFLVVNFAALAIGGFFTERGVSSEWYSSLSQAPWTPPGWVFGAAWSTVMVCFAVYMALATKGTKSIKLLIWLYIGQWILNVLWNPVFFYFHWVGEGLIILGLLAFLVGLIFVCCWSDLKWKSVLILPYLIWLLIALSLNDYILMHN